MKLPPPANAFRIPAIPAIKNRKTAWLSGNVMKCQMNGVLAALLKISENRAANCAVPACAKRTCYGTALAFFLTAVSNCGGSAE
jgi:hypothetical protein